MPMHAPATTLATSGATAWEADGSFRWFAVAAQAWSCTFPCGSVSHLVRAPCGHVLMGAGISISELGRSGPVNGFWSESSRTRLSGVSSAHSPDGVSVESFVLFDELVSC